VNKTKGLPIHLPFDYLLKNGLQFILSGNLSFLEKLFSIKRTNVENPNTHSWISGTLLETSSKRVKRNILSERRC